VDLPFVSMSKTNAVIQMTTKLIVIGAFR